MAQKRKSSFAIPMVACVGVAFATCTGPGQTGQSAMLAATAHPVPSSYEGANAVVGAYCTRCHSDRMRRGELVLEGFDLANAPQNAEAVEKMITETHAAALAEFELAKESREMANQELMELKRLTAEINEVLKREAK